MHIKPKFADLVEDMVEKYQGQYSVNSTVESKIDYNIITNTIKMKPLDKKIFQLKLMSIPTEQIAKETGLSCMNVDTRYSRLISAMKKKLHKEMRNCC